VTAEERLQGESQNTRRLGVVEEFASVHLRLLTLAIAVLGALAMVRAARVGAFRHDDFMLIGLGQDYGLSFTSLFGKPEYFEHLVPSSYALSWLMGALGPQWSIAVGFSAVLIMVLTVLVVNLARALGGSALVALAAGAAVATSLVYESMALWWPSESQQLTMLCCAAATGLFALRWIQTKSRAAFALAVLGQVAACSLYDRAQIVPVIIFFWLTVATPTSDALTRVGFAKRARDAAPIVGALLAVALLQLAVTLSLPGLNSGNLSGALKITPREWWDVAVDWWGIGVGSVAWNRFPSAWEPWKAAKLYDSAATVGGLAVLVALALATIRNKRSAAIWVSAAALISLSGVQVAALRVGFTGPVGLALTPRYQELTVLILATFIPAAWAAAGRPAPRSSAALAALSVVAVIAVAGWLINLRDGLPAQQIAPLRAATYTRNFKNSLWLWDKTHRATTFLDQRIPQDVIYRVPSTEDYNYYSKAARIMAAGLAIPPPNKLTGVLLAADREGVLRSPSIGPNHRVGPTHKTCRYSKRSADWLQPGSVVVPFQVPSALTKSGRAMVLSVRLSETTAQGKVFVMSSVSSWPVIELQLTVYPNGFRTLLPARSSSSSVQFALGAGGCVDSMELALVR